MGLYLYLKENYPEIETDVYLEEPKEGFSFLSGFREIKTVQGGNLWLVHLKKDHLQIRAYLKK